MKTAVILSDTHGNRRAIDKLDAIFKECDYIFHLGDVSADGAYIRASYPSKTVVINGNCDPVKLGEDETVIKIEDVGIFLTHGHLYGVKGSLKRLAARAKEKDCRIAFYGHTHAAREDEIDGVTLVNPGAMTRYGASGYCYLAVHENKITVKNVTLV